MDYRKKLLGTDLRSIGQSNKVAGSVSSPEEFNALFECLFDTDRVTVMRVIDAIEKITVHHPWYLQPHKAAVFGLTDKAVDKELKWHLALLLPRLTLTSKELDKAWKVLFSWAGNRKESRIVRVNSVQALYELLKKEGSYKAAFKILAERILEENIPSLNARIRKLPL